MIEKRMEGKEELVYSGTMCMACYNVANDVTMK